MLSVKNAAQKQQMHAHKTITFLVERITFGFFARFFDFAFAALGLDFAFELPDFLSEEFFKELFLAAVFFPADFLTSAIVNNFRLFIADCPFTQITQKPLNFKQKAPHKFFAPRRYLLSFLRREFQFAGQFQRKRQGPR